MSDEASNLINAFECETKGKISVSPCAMSTIEARMYLSNTNQQAPIYSLSYVAPGHPGYSTPKACYDLCLDLGV